MPNFSSAAQAILDEMDEWASYDIPTGLIAAACLRAAANQVVPEEADNENLDREGWLLWSQRLNIRFELLDIANELDGPNG
jgi:hypothetical protein